MEILEEGQKVYACEDCGCQFRLTSEKEITRNDWSYMSCGFFNMDQQRVYYDWVKCPQCGNKIIIKWRD
jgi:DNA-directed RNA polymerase subunit RPC12/RpoP